MIHKVFIDWLDEGALPLYNPWPGQTRHWLMLTDRGQWKPVKSSKLLICVTSDVSFRRLRKTVEEWLQDLPSMSEGSLAFVIRSSYKMQGGYQFVCCGAAFLPDFDLGLPLDGVDPKEVIVQVCDLDLEPERVHPIVQEAWSRKTGDAKRVEVVHRAKKILRDCLNDEQREEFDLHCRFHVRGGDGHLYRIEKGFGHNVFRIENGEPVVEYCLLQDQVLPDYDLMLTQKLLLEAAPSQFEATSNFRIMHRLNFPKAGP